MPAPPSRPRLAFAGIGRMGMPMCGRLVAAGFQVTATDVRRELREPVRAAGAQWAGSISAACAEADILLTMLPGAAEIRAAAAGIVAALADGACWLDMSTGSPGLAREIAALAAERPVRILEAPVGGGPEEARDGTLLAFAGGSRHALDRCAPVLDVLTDRVLHVGPAGAGYTVKLLVNLLWFGQAVAVAEALALAAHAGLELSTVLAALGSSASASRFLTEHAAELLGGEVLPGFPLARCLEELDSVLALGVETDTPLTLASTIAELHREALAHYGDREGELLGARFVAERAGLPLRRDR